MGSDVPIQEVDFEKMSIPLQQVHIQSDLVSGPVTVDADIPTCKGSGFYIGE